MGDISNSQVKKSEEREALSSFLEAYEAAAGESIEIICASERPDFICERIEDGRVGVELAQIRRQHPESILWDRILDKRDFMTSDHAILKIQDTLLTKETKRREPTWQCSERTLLILQLTDIPLRELSIRIESALFPGLKDGGFSEVWLADCTELEAYGDVEL